MRKAVWVLLGVSLLCAARAIPLLLAHEPPPSDAPAFGLLAMAILSAFLALALAVRPRWWHWWFPAAWLGTGAAALFLAYKETFVEELVFYGPFRLVGHVLFRLLIAPIEVFFGFAVGFIDPDAWMYVLASLVFALLGAELLRRRLWPRLRDTRAPTQRRV